MNWYPWSPEAFATARRENKPVYLSIGYSTCHWCHVMQRESFMNPAIASLLNAHFVPIKVDREERPDIDQVYQNAAKVAGWGGGWPLNLWLTPQLKPFFGGTYFPPEPRGGMTGLKELLVRIEELWRARRDDAIRDSEDISRSLAAYSRIEASSGPLVALTLASAFESFKLTFDPEQGGFGQGAKFPLPANQSFLLRYSARTGTRAARSMAARTLTVMAERGINDRVGGGFHRYTTDAAWNIPHYEKMLYDNAQLAVVYLEAYQATGDPEFARAARATLDYLLRDMARPGGGFYTAEDADEAYYLLRSTEARAKRPRPTRDDKILAGYNGLAISALAKGAQVLDEPRYLEEARRTARFLRAELYDEKSSRLYRRWRDGERMIPGFSEDYAFTVAGLLDLYETDFDPAWLAWATRLAEVQQALFYDQESGEFYSTPAGQDESLIVRPLEDADGALPSAAAVATLNGLRLSAFTGRQDFASTSARTLQRFGKRMAEYPQDYPAMLSALDFKLSKSKRISVSGIPDAPDTRVLLREIRRRYLPTTVVEFIPKQQKAKATVCQGTFCSLPTGNAASLGIILDGINMEKK